MAFLLVIVLTLLPFFYFQTHPQNPPSPPQNPPQNPPFPPQNPPQNPPLSPQNPPPLLPPLPIEIWEEIWARSPTKFLMRMTAVNKLWRDRILDPRFISKHILVYNHNKNLIICQQRLKSIWDPFLVYRTDSLECVATMKSTTSDYGSRHRIIGCRGGLWLMKLEKWSDPGLTKRVVVWNPFINKSLEVPSSESEKSDFTYVLGNFSKSISELWVARFQWSKFNKEFEFFPVEIWNLSDLQWRPATYHIIYPDSISTPSFQTPIYNGNICYWPTSTHIISFDLERFSFISWPKPSNMLTYLFKESDGIGVLGISPTQVMVFSWIDGGWTLKCSVGVCLAMGLYDSFTKEDPSFMVYDPFKDHFVFHSKSKLKRFELTTCQLKNGPTTRGKTLYVACFEESIVFAKGLADQVFIDFQDPA